MPDSPCVKCGEETTHTDDDHLPLCELCSEKLMWQNILYDIVSGKLDVQFDEQGRPIVPGVEYPKT